jgi:hypothetical protein
MLKTRRRERLAAGSRRGPIAGPMINPSTMSVVAVTTSSPEAPASSRCRIACRCSTSNWDTDAEAASWAE